ncbi:hypothetical protein J132_00241 [Termitomyces sp. J132]|nr:hypothetical protein J132_00241 [Termitomyces sp. J132]
MAGNILDCIANLLPIDLLFQKVLTRAALCLSSLLQTHLLHGPAKLAVGKLVHRHHSSLHNSFQFTDIRPNNIEKVCPTRRSYNYKPAFSTHILGSREEALEKVTEVFDRSCAAIFCNGSGYKGGVGALAVFYMDGEEISNLKFHLSSGAEHIVYEAEIVALYLGLHILQGLNNWLHSQNICCSDSQAMLKALNNQRLHLAHYLLDKVHLEAENLHRKQDHLLNVPCKHAVAAANTEWVLHSRGVIRLQLYWSLRHEGFTLNERANQLVKEVATGSAST